jgi:hypothetical protein
MRIPGNPSQHVGRIAKTIRHIALPKEGLSTAVHGGL